MFFSKHFENTAVYRAVSTVEEGGQEKSSLTHDALLRYSLFIGSAEGSVGRGEQRWEKVGGRVDLAWAGCAGIVVLI